MNEPQLASDELKVKINDLDICYQQFGRIGDPVILLIMGLAQPMTAWPDPFCQHLIDAGFRVIRFDNRDIGLSSRVSQLGQPPIERMLLRRLFGLRVTAPYSLSDMVNDTVALLDHLQIAQAHVVGVSMGGMIGQRFALDHPQRVLSLTSMLSTTGQWRHGFLKFRLLKLILQKPSATQGVSNQTAAIEYGLKFWRLAAGRRYPYEPELLRPLMLANWQRSSDFTGVRRQLAAIAAAPARHRELRALRCPTLVIHGTDDPLVRVGGGIATAKAIPNARLELIEGLGHDLPSVLHETLCGFIVEHALGSVTKLAHAKAEQAIGDQTMVDQAQLSQGSESAKGHAS